MGQPNYRFIIHGSEREKITVVCINLASLPYMCLDSTNTFGALKLVGDVN